MPLGDSEAVENAGTAVENRTAFESRAQPGIELTGEVAGEVAGVVKIKGGV